MKIRKKSKLTAAAVLIAALIFLASGCGKTKTPVLTIEAPRKISIKDGGEFTLDADISSLGDAAYPAASFSISFDNSKLEFTGLKEGNVFVYGGEKDKKKQPEWRYDVENANKNGKINIIYIHIGTAKELYSYLDSADDQDSGKYAFSKTLLPTGKKTLFSLSFSLRGGAKSGDVYTIKAEDAVFAASDSSLSLALNENTLKVKDGRIVVGE